MPKSSPKSASEQDFMMRQLFDAYSWFDESLQHSMQVSGAPGLSRSQSMVMVYLGKGVRRPSALARKLRVTRQAMHKTINDLESKGYVQLVPDRDDRRAKIVRLSATGLRRHRMAQACLMALEKELCARLGKKKVAALIDALQADWGDSPVEKRVAD